MQYLPVLVEKFLNGPRQNPCDSVYALLITRAIISPRYLQEFLTLIDRLDILLSIDWVGRDRECSFQTTVGTTITNQSDLQRKTFPNWIFDESNTLNGLSRGNHFTQYCSKCMVSQRTLLQHCETYTSCWLISLSSKAL